MKSFFKIWEIYKDSLGGIINTTEKGFNLWQPMPTAGIREAASKVLEVFYSNFGHKGGCKGFDHGPQCRGALAAASLVTSMHILYALTVVI